MAARVLCCAPRLITSPCFRSISSLRPPWPKVRSYLRPESVVISTVRNSSYQTSPIENPQALYTDYIESKDPEEWKYVERLLPKKIIVQPSQKSDYPSGWKPSTDEALAHPYHVRRTKNHMLPVYLHETFRGHRKLTHIRYISGDIWALEKELQEHLQLYKKKLIPSQVNEYVGRIIFKGNFVDLCQKWLLNKGF